MWACILFVSTEAMFFLALFTTYFFLRARVPEWEPVFQRCAEECEKPHATSVTPIFGVPVPLVAINTAFLLASSVTMQFAVNAIKRGDQRGLQIGRASCRERIKVYVGGVSFNSHYIP